MCKGFEDVTKWVLVHDGSNVLFKGQAGAVCTPVSNTIVDFASEALMDADIISLGIIDLVED